MFGWGGRRRGAGAKPRGRRRVPHRRRPFHARRNPLHVTLRVRDGLPSLRSPALAQIIRRCIGKSGKEWFRVVEFSILRNNIHLIVEADDRIRLARGVAGLKIRIAKNVNKSLGRKGAFFAGRYHARALTTPSEVRNGLLYTLNNARKHAFERGRRLQRDWLDPCSSAHTFAGWIDRIDRRLAPRSTAVTSPAQTWLLRHGWRMLGRLDPNAIPGST